MRVLYVRRALELNVSGSRLSEVIVSETQTESSGEPKSGKKLLRQQRSEDEKISPQSIIFINLRMDYL